MEAITCIICPMGCQLEYSLDTTEKTPKVVNVTGNECNRGPEYVQKEILNPTRTLTTTVTVHKGNVKLVPVKTDGEVPKHLLTQCMEVVRRTECTAPLKRGHIILADILGTGVNVVSCSEVEKV